ncbi:MAG: MFS transporter [Oscillospiraceae bacterium]
MDMPGAISGSRIPFGACLALVLTYQSIGISMKAAMAIAFFIIALWWLGGSLPLLRSYRQTHYVEAQRTPVRDSFRRLGGVFSELRQRPDILFFLLAFFFYIDGCIRSLIWRRPYGTALGLDHHRACCWHFW